MAKKSQPEPSEPTWIFEAHSTPSLYGAGSELEAQRLCSLMNEHRALSRWEVRAVDKAGHPMMDIAAEIERHRVARAA